MTRVTIPARRQLMLAAAAFALSAPAFAWHFGGETVQGSGTIRTEARKADHFSGVSLALPGKVELHIGLGEGVSVEADDNLLPLIETSVENGTLKIRPTRNNLNLRPHTLRITVNARAIDSLGVAGSGSIVADPLRARSFKASVSGSGSIDARSIDGDNLDVNVAGSGNLVAGGGSMKQVKIAIAGSGDVDLGKLKANDVRVHTTGSGNSTVWASGSLDVAVAGSGDVSYYGDARVSRSVLGSGEVKRLGGTPR